MSPPRAPDTFVAVRTTFTSNVRLSFTSNIQNTKMNNSLLSETRIKRLRAQGYSTQSAQELSDMAFGIRFPYRLCVTILSVGVLFANIPILALMMAMAALSIVLPNHPFDYIYNHLLSKRMGKPVVPPRSIQLKFTCTLATAWIGTMIFLFSSGMMTGGYILGVMLIITATLPSTIDLCIPSVLFNAIFGKKMQSVQESV